MRILYGIQGTGSGHISRAQDLLPELKKYADVTVLYSGNPNPQNLPTGVDIDKILPGYGFLFGNNGGIDFKSTIQTFSFRRLLKDIWSVELKGFDIVISDFEPISAWAAKLRGVPCLSLSHQCALISPDTPNFSDMSIWQRLLLKYYAPSKSMIGFHFERYSDAIEPPIIRQSIRSLSPYDDGHYVVYLPAYKVESQIEILRQIDEDWIIFSPKASTVHRVGNVLVLPCDQQRFLRYLESARGVICTAGFELPSEALYLNKKLLVTPMKGQFEQRMNAVAVKRLGATVVHKLSSSQIAIIRHWCTTGRHCSLPAAANVNEIVQSIFALFAQQSMTLQV